MTQILNSNANHQDVSSTVIMENAVDEMLNSNRDKQQTQWIQLLTLVKEMKEVVGDATASKSKGASQISKKADNDSSSSQASGNYRGNLCDALAAAAFALEQLYALIGGKYSEKTTQDGYDVLNTLNQISQQKLQDTQNRCQEVQDALDAEARMSPIEKIFSAIAFALGALMCIITGNLGMAAVMIAMEIMNQTGATNKIIGDSAAASWALVGVTILLSCGQSLAMAGEEVAEDVAAQAEKSIAAKVAEAFKPGTKLGSLAIAVQNTSQMLLSNNSFVNIMNSMPLSASEKTKLEAIIGVIIAALGALSGCLSAAGAANGAKAAAGIAEEAGAANGAGQEIEMVDLNVNGVNAANNAANAEQEVGAIKSLLNRLRSSIMALVKNLKLDNPNVVYAVKTLQASTTITAGGLSIAEGATQMKLGNLTSEMTADLAMMMLYQTFMDIATEQIQSNLQTTANQVQSNRSGTQSISGWLDGQREAAQIIGQV